jgi:hypothetical protein
MNADKFGSPQAIARNVVPGVLPNEWVRKCPYIEVSNRCSCAGCPHDSNPLHASECGRILCCNVSYREVGL